MPVPLNRSTYAKYTEPGIQHLNRLARNQSGVNNQSLKGKVSSQYVGQRGMATSIMRRHSDSSAFAYDCLAQFGSGLLNLYRPEFTPARNQAYERFKEEATGDQSALGTTFYEWRQTLDLVTSNALAVRNAWRNFRRGRFARLKDKVRLNPARGTCRVLDTPRRLAEQASNAWLQWWFGVSPLIGDATAAAHQASDQIPSNENYEGSSRRVIFERSGTLQKVELDGLYRVSTGARVKLSNPNLYLASQLGLINPISIAYEVIPFSFVADWAFDISGFVNSFSDFAGCEISMPYTMTVIKGTTATFRPDVYSGKWVSHQVQCQRTTQLIRPTPNFQVRANLGASLTRAASAAALLIQALR